MQGAPNLQSLSRSIRSLNEAPSMTRSTRSQNPEESYICRISLCVTNRKAIIEHLDLARFKTEKCTKEACRNHKTCPFYHSGSDWRRDPFTFTYSPDPCEFGRNCFSRTKCLYAHNKYESNYHPRRYKMRYCKYLLEITRCKAGKYCADAHNDQDIRIELLHTFAKNDDFFIFKFKTEFCPFQMEHNVRKCVYGHSWEDFRRPILKHPYSNSLCKHHPEIPFGKLEYRCREGLKCPLSHNLFERDFHPQSYKKYACQFPECDASVCPFLHRDESPRFRVIDQNKDFYIYPYNRILPTTFVEKESFFLAKSPNIY